MQAFIDQVIPFIINHQQSDGSFTTYESYPVVNPAAGWTKLPDPSPFITANILYALISLNDARLQSVISKGAHCLLQSKEGNGYWRFWPLKSKQHPLPLDMDDTCMALAVLNKCGYTFNNRSVLLANKNYQGYFLTWLKPRLKHFFSSPATGFQFYKDYLAARPTQRLKYFTYDDNEPAIAANTLLYLGQCEQTMACIQQIITEVESAHLPKKFYDDDMVILYHIARAFTGGVTAFKVLRQTVATAIKKSFAQAVYGNDLTRAMAANVLLDFGVETALAEELLKHIISGQSFAAGWVVDPYFCSNDKNFLAGSPVLTAAVFAEACAKFNRLKQT